MIKKLALIVIFFFVIPPIAYSYQADVQDISQDKYYEATLDAIKGAKESIYVVMYYVNWDPFNKDSKPHALVQALIDAHRRGVKVDVILDQTMDISRGQDEAIEDWELLKAKNVYIYELLQKEGINVAYDTPGVNTHSKVIIIDGETVILGSSNWTETALNSNVESNLLVKSKKIAEELLEDFERIETQRPNINTSGANIKISFKLLEDPKLLSRMASENDEMSLDLYLELLRRSNPEANTVTISYDKIIEDLKLTQKQPRVLINRALAKLQDDYGLISFKKEDIFREDTITLNITPLPDTRFIELPVAYFTYDWDKKLSLRAKVLYLVSLAYYTTSDSKPWFFASQNNIEGKFHLKKWYISNGMQELRKLNIIDIKYSKFDEDSDEPRQANYYKVLGLYDPAKVDEKFKSLSTRYGEANVQKARNHTKVVYKENDPEVVEELLKLTTDYGEEAVKKAVRIVAKKRPDNPKRNFIYLKAIIEKSPRQTP